MRLYKVNEAKAIRRAWSALEHIAEQSDALNRLATAERVDFAERGTDRTTVRTLLMDTIGGTRKETLDGLCSGHCIALGVRATCQKRQPAEFLAWRRGLFAEAQAAAKAASTRQWDALSASIDERIGV